MKAEGAAKGGAIPTEDGSKPAEKQQPKTVVASSRVTPNGLAGGDKHGGKAVTTAGEDTAKAGPKENGGDKSRADTAATETEIPVL